MRSSGFAATAGAGVAAGGVAVGAVATLGVLVVPDAAGFEVEVGLTGGGRAGVTAGVAPGVDAVAVVCAVVTGGATDLASGGAVTDPVFFVSTARVVFSPADGAGLVEVVGAVAGVVGLTGGVTSVPVTS